MTPSRSLTSTCPSPLGGTKSAEQSLGHVPHCAITASRSLTFTAPSTATSAGAHGAITEPVCPAKLVGEFTMIWPVRLSEWAPSVGTVLGLNVQLASG